MKRPQRVAGFLRRNFRDCTPHVKAATYNMMVCPTLEYASTVWDPHEQQHIDALEAVQRRAARYVRNNYREREPGTVTNMLRDLGWKNLEERRRLGRLGMLYKIKNDLVDIDKSKFFKPSDERTRGDKIHQEANFHSSLFHSFFPRTISDWNKLPFSVMSAPTYGMFMSQLGGHRSVPPPAPHP